MRTLAEGEPGYNSVAHHTGSVWPQENAIVAHGLRRYGYDEDFMKIFEGMLEAASRFRDYRLAERFAGFSRREYESPVPYPIACRPAGVGGGDDSLPRSSAPCGPRWINRMQVEGMRVPAATVALRFERTGTGVTLADASIDRDLPTNPGGGLPPRNVPPGGSPPRDAERRTKAAAQRKASQTQSLA